MRRSDISDICLLRSSGSGSPARKHHHLYLPYQIPFTATCRAISSLSKTATYASSMSIGRVYVQPGAKIAVSDFTVKGPQDLS